MKDPLIQEEESSFRDRRATTIVSQDRVISLPIQGPSQFLPNGISTSKYNCITFLPKNLWEQFHKLANVYFLGIAVLQSIPEISVSGGIPNILLPLGFVLCVSAIKDLLEDFKRKSSDKDENTRSTMVRRNNTWESVLWKDINVGDIVKIAKDDNFPADIVLLNSSEPKGICYIETKNLDGETNLKHKLASKDTISYFSDISRADDLVLSIRCEDPNPMIYQFYGVLDLSGTTIPLSNEQFLLRGSSLKNTDWIVGIVVYTGHESKIMLNSSNAKTKYSKLETQMNKQIIFVFLMQLALCVTCALFYAIWFSQNKDNTDQYLELTTSQDNTLLQFVILFFSWMLIFTNFVPISLLVTLEMVKFLQAIFISWDLKLYYEEGDIPARVQSSNLNEELGQINHVFSDKTGTLTCNVMEFRKCSIMGVSYGTEERLKTEKASNVDFVDPNFNPSDQNAEDFLLHLATCHTIITEEKEDEIEYRASSPDELALVNAAKYFGIKFIGRDGDQNILIDLKGKVVKIAVLNVIEFNSDRKRMSVIVRLPDGRIRLMCKGADSIILPRLVNSKVIESTWEHLEDYANSGLRTLVIAYKDLTDRDYESWNSEFVAAMGDIHNREEKIAKLAEELEQNMDLLGATAIEDKLQDKVPETIKNLRSAGVKVWVLTGDKIETAINIGFSCSLLTSGMARILVQGQRSNEVQEELKTALSTFKISPSSEFALIISGEALIKATKKEIIEDLVAVTDNCSVVLACRVSPQQKAEIVEMIRERKPTCRTLAIGDGANDVNMILAAHVGLGISGLEGQQAARASDFSVGQFCHMQRLMFVHGRECYRRNATLICYNFYKNVLLVTPLFFYGFFSVFSGQVLYNMWLYQLFNMFFASMPICVYAIFDKEIDYDEIENEPKYYNLGLKGNLFSTSVFWGWILEATLQGLAITILVVYSVCSVTGSHSTGRIDSMYVASVIIISLVVICVNMKVVIFSYTHYWFSVLIVALSILVYFSVCFMITDWFPIHVYFDNFNARGASSRMFENPNFYFASVVLIYGSFFIQPFLKEGISLYYFRKSTTRVEDMEMPEAIDKDREKLLEEIPSEIRESSRVSLERLTRRHTGYAFSGEPGHTPQITDPKFQG